MGSSTKSHQNKFVERPPVLQYVTDFSKLDHRTNPSIVSATSPQFASVRSPNRLSSST